MLNQMLKIINESTLDGVGYAANLISFCLSSEAGEYALHAQGLVRFITECDEIIAANYDLFLDQEWIMEDGTEEKRTLWEEEHPLILSMLPLKIENAIVNALGDICLYLDGGARIEILTATASPDVESWRFFKIHSDEEHLINNEIDKEVWRQFCCSVSI